jgi:serine/threonine protein kinase/tetratricopeptide (TPR) repeat protein
VAAYDRQEADRLLTGLLDLPPGQRPEALAAIADEAMRETVKRLLRAADAPDSPFGPDGDWSVRLWQGLADDVAQRESPIAPGAMVGPYRILEEIGRGGMAIVYRADRIDGEFNREVAVKLLKLGIDTEEVVRRFEQERQILADLDHPNIARLLDAGHTADRRPYFVMELVEGQPIDRYCDERQLSVEERLELFCVVAGAVEHAHQNLVVHRDLKPSNILVTTGGEVKLLDFGVAGLLDVDAGAATPVTRTLMRLMTPEYASPEQVRGERAATASDVYQLGLLLYELLTGHRAYTIATGAPGEFERTVCEQMPTRPSTAVGQPQRPRLASDATRTAATDIGRARRSSTARLQRRLRGDLDNIVLKALRKEPERRYGSADRLAQDIRRHLGGMPVAARADTWMYRGHKFLRRHAVGVGVALLLLVLAAGMIGFHTVRIQSERDRAQVEAAKAQQVSRFLTGLFRSADPREARGTELTARELLDRGVEQVDRELAALPDVQTDMLHVLGRTYLELGAYEPADRLLTRALDLHRRQPASEQRTTARILGDLGELRHAQGEHQRARVLLEEAVALFERSPGDESSEFASVLRALGHLLYREFGEHDNSRVMLERALAIQERASGEHSDAVAPILHSLGDVFFEIGDLDRAETVYQRAVSIHDELGADHPAAGSALISLAFIRLEQGKTDGLEAMYRRGFANLEKAYGPTHKRVAAALNNLGHLLTEAGRIDEAIEILQRALEVRTEAVGANHPDIAYPLASLGDAHFAGGRFSQARDYYRRSLAAREAEPGLRRFDPLQVHAHVKLGRIESELSDVIAAGRHMDRARELLRDAPESTDPRLAPSLIDLGDWLVEQQRCPDAAPLLQRVDHLQAAHPPRAAEQREKLQSLLAQCR